jgi:superfamily I DNA/RNA helicase
MTIIRSEPQSSGTEITEREVDGLNHELIEMDADVVAYLKDPAGQPTPEFDRLISRIQALPERSHFPRALALKISNLKYKALYFERAWRQIRENVAEVTAAQAKGRSIPQERRKETYFCAPTPARKGKLEAEGVKVVDMLYDMQAMKLKEHGADSAAGSRESIKAFKARIAGQYRRIREKGQGEKKVVLVWNESKKRCDLIVDRRTDG